MKEPERPIAEEDLHAYVDDLLDPCAGQPLAAIWRRIGSHPTVSRLSACKATSSAPRSRRVRRSPSRRR